MTFTSRILLSILSLFAAFSISVSAYRISVSSVNAHLELEERQNLLLDFTSHSISPLYWSLDETNIISFSKTVSREPMVKGVLVYPKLKASADDNYGIQVTGFVKDVGEISELVEKIELLAPPHYDEFKTQRLVWGEEDIGEVRIYFDNSKVSATIHERAKDAFIDLVLQLVIFGTILYLFLSTQFITPFKKAHKLATSLGANYQGLIASEKTEKNFNVNSVGSLLASYEADLDRKDEVGDFYRSFKSLCEVVSNLVNELSQHSVELRLLNDELEERVKKRTKELSFANDKLQQSLDELKSAQSRLLQQEKLASLGQLAAGVAHEINNPVGYVSSNVNRLSEYFNDLISIIEYLLKQLAEGKAVDVSIDSISEHQTSELKQLLYIVYEDLDYDFLKQDVPELIAECLEGMGRVQEIVSDLKDFARVDDAKQKGEFDINDAILSTLKLVWNELKYDCTVEKELEPEVRLVGNHSQINQVISNILVNAAHAIKKTGQMGKITIRSWNEDEWGCFSIRDSGVGISEEVKSKVFDPFFTTKPVGQGTGLGLNISYDIVVNQHHGVIEIESEIGQGACFTVKLPLDGEG